ncbi:MAG: hypothetical protein IKQ18_09345 [Clostridia bacterium]|nr:hypothetical protein [Clostridia bacterium]MBR6922771.1 hypothetical protein [Clostridia bacterium]
MKEKQTSEKRMKPAVEAAVIILIILVLSVLAFVLVKIFSPRTETGDDTGTDTETTEFDTRTYQEMPYDDLDYDKVDEYVKKVYDHRFTTVTPLVLKQEVSVDDLDGWGKIKQFGNVMQYYDSSYELKPVEYNNKTVMYKPPYVRYTLQGYPAYATPGDFVTHVEICGVDTVYVCGINVNSSFEDFEEVFSALGFTVTREKSPTSYGKRQIIRAAIDGFWIILEKESELELKKGIYQYKSVIEYENNVVPAILRMGLAVNHYSRVEQFILP